MRASAHGRKKVVQLLLDNGANLSTVNESKETALDTARREGHREIVELLTKSNTERMFSEEDSNRLEEAQSTFQDGTAFLKPHAGGTQSYSTAKSIRTDVLGHDLNPNGKVNTETWNLPASQIDPVTPNEPLDLADLELDRNNRLGSGAFGFVYKCNFTGVNVAVKEMKLPHSKNSKTEANELLIGDILVCAAIHHPSIVQFMGYCSERQGSSHYLLLVYELIDGHNLEDILVEAELKRAYDFTQTRKYHVLLQVSQALAYLHSQNPCVIHSNIKPSNIMVTTSGCAKICDLGQSKVKQNYAGLLAIRPSALYTVLYMAPEQLLHPKISTVKSDVYAFGILLHKVVFDDDVWEVNDFEEFQIALDKMRTLKIPPVLQKRFNHPAYCVTVKCLEYDYHKRPESWSVVGNVEALYSAECAKCNNTLCLNQI